MIDSDPRKPGMEIDPRVEAQTALSGLLNRLTWLALTLGVVSTALGLLRISSMGWHVNVVTDLLFFAPILVVLLLRKRMPVNVVIVLLVVLAASSAVVNFLTLGLGTMAFVILTACCTIVGVVFGMRPAFLLLAGSVAVVGVIGSLACRGLLPDLQTTDPFLLNPATWVTQIAGFAVYTAVILVVSGTLQTRLAESLSKVSRQAEELRESEQRYRLLADNMHDVLFLQGLDFSVQYLSPSAERLFGYTIEEFRRIDAKDLMTEESRERANEAFEKYLALSAHGDVEIPPMEFEYLRKDGSSFWGEVSPSFVRDHEGRIVVSQGLIRDVTERRRIEAEREELERELRQSEKLKAIGQLAGGIAHDLNNQLMPIMAHADLLARGPTDAETVASHARKILRPAANAADLTGKLLAFARKGSYEHQPVDMHDVINEVVEILAHGIDRRIAVKRHFEAVSAVVEGDRTQLQNALLNLGLNSRDAITSSGEIVFKTTTVHGEVPGQAPELVVSVEDTGEGMDDEVQKRAFEPFFTTKPPGKGTGMGLAAAYGTVASHHGRIELRSRQGRGTCVSVHLPCTDVGVRSAVVAMSERIAAELGTVLLIDDEDGVRSALTDLLESLGCSVAAFAKAADGTAYYRRHWRDVDLVVLDLVLQDMTGREALVELREINPEVRVLLASGYSADEEVQQLLHSDRVEFLEKPFLLADLAECLMRLTRSR